MAGNQTEQSCVAGKDCVILPRKKLVSIFFPNPLPPVSGAIIGLNDETKGGELCGCLCAGKRKLPKKSRIARKTNLYRPAVSHHLGILKDAGLIDVRREGTKNYYYFDSDMKSIKKLIAALQAAVDVAKQLPDQEEEL